MSFEATDRAPVACGAADPDSPLRGSNIGAPRVPFGDEGPVGLRWGCAGWDWGEGGERGEGSYGVSLLRSGAAGVSAFFAPLVDAG